MFRAKSKLFQIQKLLKFSKPKFFENNKHMHRSKTLNAKLKLKLATAASLSLVVIGLALHSTALNLNISNTAFAANFTFKQIECPSYFQALSGQIGIEVKIDKNQIPELTSKGEVKYKPTTFSFEDFAKNAATNPKVQLIAQTCPCTLATTVKQVLGVSGTAPASGSTRTAFQENANAAAWIKAHQQLACRYIQINKIEDLTVGEKKVSYCKIKQSNLDNLSVEDFRAFDTSNDCKIEGDEVCKKELAEGRVKCASKYNPTITVKGKSVKCSEIHKYYCKDNTPKKIDLGDFDSESLDTKLLKTTGQKGFINITDQGAGPSNPAINFILNIINILTNLAFFVSMFFLIMGGFYMVMASNNSDMQDKGKNAIKYFIFGISFVLLSYLIVILIEAYLF
jgi:hypothetical protein